MGARLSRLFSFFSFDFRDVDFGLDESDVVPPSEIRIPRGAQNSSLEAAAAKLASCRRILLLTGAGISTDSGIPDFRGPDGLWTKHPGAQRSSHIEHFVSDVQAREAQWRMQVAFADEGAGGEPPQPNAGHHACAVLESTGRLRALVTQNIDGLHQATGMRDDVIIEAHGGVSHVVCLGCKARTPTLATLERVRRGDHDPKCHACGGLLKPDVVFFGEALPHAALARAAAAVRECDALVAIGSTLSVAPINTLPMAAKLAGAVFIVVNNGETQFDDAADFLLQGPISDVLPKLFRVDARAPMPPPPRL